MGGGLYLPLLEYYHLLYDEDCLFNSKYMLH